MRNFMLVAMATLILGSVACGDKEDDTGDTAGEEAADTAREETE